MLLDIAFAGFSAESPLAAHRLHAISSTSSLTHARLVSRPLSDVRAALTPDMKPVVGNTPMKVEAPVAVRCVHRDALLGVLVVNSAGLQCLTERSSRCLRRGHYVQDV